MTTKNDVIGLAKTTKKPAAKKSAIKKPIEKKVNIEEERDLKAKAKVKELLQDSPIITLDKNEDLLELEEPTKEEPKGVEWLEEQVTLLNQKNETLIAELNLIKIENQTLKVNNSLDDGNISKVVVQLFNELQENFIKMGIDNRGIGNFRIYCPGFLNRLIKFFPFLEQHKKY